MCGAIGSRSSTGVIASADGAPGPAARARASVSSLAQAPSCVTAPAATGFIGATRSAARAQGVHERAGGERLAHAGVGAGHEDAAAHRGAFGGKSMTWRPSASRFGGTFQACP